MTAETTDVDHSDAGARPGPDEIVRNLAMEIARLDPGSAAALRRGPLAGAGAAAFWQLLAKHDIVLGEQAWATVIQAIAILTGVGGGGTPGTTTHAHDPKTTMGGALFGAGVSDLRLARLLAAQEGLRSELAVRMCRRLARDPAHRRFDLRTLARFLVYADANTDQRIAREYYRAEAQKRHSQTQEEGPDA